MEKLQKSNDAEMDIEIDPEQFMRCRLCVEEKGQYQITPNIQEQIKNCFDIKVWPFDGFSQLVCKKCKTILNEFSLVKSTFQSNQKLLVNKAAQTANAENSHGEQAVSSSQQDDQQQDKPEAHRPPEAQKPPEAHNSTEAHNLPEEHNPPDDHPAEELNETIVQVESHKKKKKKKKTEKKKLKAIVCSSESEEELEKRGLKAASPVTSDTEKNLTRISNDRRPSKQESLVSLKSNAKKGWSEFYRHHFVCKYCDRYFVSQHTFSRHFRLHDSLRKTVGKLTPRHCTIDMIRYDAKRNLTGTEDIVVLNANRLVENENNLDYFSMFLPRNVDESTVENNAGSGDDSLSVPTKLKYKCLDITSSSDDEHPKKSRLRKRIRLMSNTSTETMVIGPSAHDGSDKEVEASRPSSRNSLAPCISIDSSSDSTAVDYDKSDAANTKTTTKTNKVVSDIKIIENIVKACYKKDEKNNDSYTTIGTNDDSLNRKVLNIGRKIMTKQGISSPGLLKFLEERNLPIQWHNSIAVLSQASNSKENGYVRIMTKLDNPPEHNLNGFEVCVPVVANSKQYTRNVGLKASTGNSGPSAKASAGSSGPSPKASAGGSGPRPKATAGNSGASSKASAGSFGPSPKGSTGSCGPSLQVWKDAFGGDKSKPQTAPVNKVDPVCHKQKNVVTEQSKPPETSQSQLYVNWKTMGSSTTLPDTSQAKQLNNTHIQPSKNNEKLPPWVARQEPNLPSMPNLSTFYQNRPQIAPSTPVSQSSQNAPATLTPIIDSNNPATILNENPVPNPKKVRKNKARSAVSVIDDASLYKSQDQLQTDIQNDIQTDIQTDMDSNVFNTISDDENDLANLPKIMSTTSLANIDTEPNGQQKYYPTVVFPVPPLQSMGLTSPTTPTMVRLTKPIVSTIVRPSVNQPTIRHSLPVEQIESANKRYIKIAPARKKPEPLLRPSPAPQPPGKPSHNTSLENAIQPQTSNPQVEDTQQPTNTPLQSAPRIKCKPFSELLARGVASNGNNFNQASPVSIGNTFNRASPASNINNFTQTTPNANFIPTTQASSVNNFNQNTPASNVNNFIQPMPPAPTRNSFSIGQNRNNGNMITIKPMPERRSTLESIIMHTEVLPRCTTSSAFKYLEQLFGLHSIILKSPYEIDTTQYACLIKFKLNILHPPMQIMLSLMLLGKDQNFCVKVTSDQEVVDVREMSPVWQWEVLKSFRDAEVKKKVVATAEKVSPVLHRNAQLFVVLLENIEIQTDLTQLNLT